MPTPTETHKEPVGFIIKRLMKRCGLREAELARMVDLPQTTINRLLTGTTYDPRANTLRPIANFFNLTIGQLLGDEPIEDEELGVYSSMDRRSWTTVPLITWENVRFWLFERERFTPKNHAEWVATDSGVGGSTYALKTMPFMEPHFKRGSTIIVDPDKPYQDGGYIVVSLKGAEPTVRQVVQEGSSVYLTPLQPNIPSDQLSNEHMVLGTVIESRVRL